MADRTVSVDIVGRDKASRALNSAAKSANHTHSSIAGLAKVAATAAVATGVLAVALGKRFVSDARESAKVAAITASQIKTTGGAANLSAKQIGDLATAVSNKTGIDDEAIQANENLLLSFRKVRDEAGKGNKIFSRTTALAQDMATVMGTDAAGATKQLGKALQDPIKGITALTKSGVVFTEKQKAHIKSLVEEGKTLQAQKIILREVGKEFGGAATAAATPMDKLKVTLGNVSEALGAKLIPFIDKGAVKLREFITQVQTGTGPGGVFAAKMGEIGAKAKALWEISLPLIKGLVDMIKAVASLPAPVLALGAAFVVANSAVGGLSGKLSGLSGKFKEAGGGLKGFSALAGGPWTLALTAGVAILGSFIAKHVAAKAVVNNLTASLNTETGAITGATRAQAYDNLVKSGAVAAANKLGINLADLTDAYLGNKSAQDRVNVAVGTANKEIGKQTKLTGAGAGAHNQLSTANRDLAGAVNKVTGAVGTGNKAMREAKKAAADARQALAGMGAAASTAGANFSAGLAVGIQAGTRDVEIASQGVAAAAVRAANAELKNKSPSKVGIKVGGFLSEGIAIGITLKGKKAVDAMKTLVDNVKSKLSELRSTAAGISSGAADSVRGILDVSGIGAAGTSPSGVLRGFAAQAGAFAKALAKMRAHKLAPAIIAAVAAAGPSALGAANAFASESAANVRSDNRSIGRIDAAARSAGRTALSSTAVPKQIAETNHLLRQLIHDQRGRKVGEIEIRNGKVFVTYVNKQNHNDKRRGQQ